MKNRVKYVQTVERRMEKNTKLNSIFSPKQCATVTRVLNKMINPPQIGMEFCQLWLQLFSFQWELDDLIELGFVNLLKLMAIKWKDRKIRRTCLHRIISKYLKKV